MVFKTIPESIAPQIEQPRLSRKGNPVSPVLRPEIIECVKANVKENGVPIRYEYQAWRGVGIFFYGVRNLDNTPEGDRVYVWLKPREHPTLRYLEGFVADRVEPIFKVLMKCARPEISEAELEKEVAAHEGRRAYRDMLGWEIEDRKTYDASGNKLTDEEIKAKPPLQLPAEVAKRIGEFAAVKKIQGGRKTRAKGRKAKRTRRQGKK